MPERTFLKVEEVAARWGITDGMVRRMLREGSLSGMRVGSTWRVPTDAIVAYEEAHMTQIREPVKPQPKEPKPVVRQIV